VSNRVHEIRNHLTVVVSNVEAFRDGIVDPTPERLTTILDELAQVEILLREISSGERQP
jgi:signal transduction histidine kinase